MAATNRHKAKRWSEEKISSAVLIVLITLSVVVFALFFSVGYDEPWEENTEFINPRYTDVLMAFMFFTGAVALMATVWAVIRNARHHAHILNVNGGVPSGKIAMAVVVILIATMVLTYSTAADGAIIINGKSYTDMSWLNIADMCIHTIEVLFVLAVMAVIYGMSGINRRIQKH